MWTIISTIIIFLQIFYWLIIIDVILSWLSLAGIKRPQFLANLIDPIYNSIKKVVPTTIWWLDFTPIILILFIDFLIAFIMKTI